MRPYLNLNGKEMKLEIEHTHTNERMAVWDHG